jgi:DNA-binding LacI/PurR family transcriptional regulator
MSIDLNKKPRYQQIAHAIHEQVRAGILKAGDKLPSERELCDTWQASLITVRRSLLELAKAGVVVTRQGVGSFVASATPAESSTNDSHGLLGVVIPAASDYHNGRVLSALEQSARRLGYSLIIKQSGNTPQGEAESMSLLAERNVMGVLIAPIAGDTSQTVLSCAKLLTSKIPFVLMDRYLPLLNVPYVTIDNVRGGYEVTRHLVEAGHRKIAYLRGIASSSADDREKGYRQALVEAGLEPHIEVVGNQQYEMACARERFASFLDRSQGDVTAVFAENDGFARAVYDVCRERGLRIPEDLAVAGFDDAPYSALLMPSLTTVVQPYVQIAHRAMTLLIELIHGKTPATTQVILPPGLVVRESTGGGRSSAEVQYVQSSEDELDSGSV